MRFSIIVPVFNTFAYLRECVRSVLTQNYSDFELILINDGSTDGSGPLCDELATTDSRIQVIHQKNRGAASARNAGLRCAQGDWILFLDSDDFYTQNDFLNKLSCVSSDLICFNYARYTDALAPNCISNTVELPTNMDARKKTLVQMGAFTSSSCLKAVRRNLICERSLSFENGVLCEDIEWSAWLLCLAQTIDFLPDICYAYRVRSGSTTQTISNGHVQDLCRAIDRLTSKNIEFLTPLEKEAYWGYVAFQYATLMINVRICRPKANSELKQLVRSHQKLLRHDLLPQVKWIRRANAIMGYSFTSWLLSIYFNTKNITGYK